MPSGTGTNLPGARPSGGTKPVLILARPQTVRLVRCRRIQDEGCNWETEARLSNELLISNTVVVTNLRGNCTL